MSALVAVLMGSKSDMDVMNTCMETLTQFGIEHEVHVMSAHRSPAMATEFAASAETRGIEVLIAAAGGAVKTKVAAELGADVTVDYTVPGWADEVGPVDVVFDGVGGEVGAASLGALRPGGRFVLFGLASGRPTTVDRGDVTLLGFEVLGQIGARADEFSARALAEAAAGRLRPLVGQTFPLADAAAAHTAIESRATVGKTLLIP